MERIKFIEAILAVIAAGVAIVKAVIKLISQCGKKKRDSDEFAFAG